MRWIIAFDQREVDDFAKLLREQGDRPLHLRPTFERIVVDFHDSERGIFESAGASEGLDWPPIKSDTLRRHPDHHAPMDMTGALKKSLTESRSRYSVVRISEDQVEMGTRDPVANLHQHRSRHGLSSKGTSYTNAERQVMFISFARQDMWLDWITDDILADRETSGIGV